MDRFEAGIALRGTEVKSIREGKANLQDAYARVEEGGAPELLQQLAHVYLGPDVKFPPMDDPPPGFITHIAVEHIGGVGPWAG